MTLAHILAQNLSTLMVSTGTDTDDKVAKRTGLGRGTVDRLRKAEVSARLETVEALAKGFGVSSCYLLTDHLTPSPGHQPICALDGLTKAQAAKFMTEIQAQRHANEEILEELASGFLTQKLR